MSPPEHRQDRPPIIVQLGPHNFIVAVWSRDEDGEPVYEIAHHNIHNAKLACELARQEWERLRGSLGREPT
jgi:hypothetical protein